MRETTVMLNLPKYMLPDYFLNYRTPGFEMGIGNIKNHKLFIVVFTTALQVKQAQSAEPIFLTPSD